MRRMYSKSQLIDLIEEHSQEGAVKSVNGLTGTVVLKDDHIPISTDLTRTKTIHSELERIDETLDTKQQQLNASYGISITEDGPTSYNISVDTNAIQQKLTAGSGIAINNNVISCTASSSGLYKHTYHNPNSVADDIVVINNSASLHPLNSSDIAAYLRNSLSFTFGVGNNQTIIDCFKNSGTEIVLTWFSAQAFYNEDPIDNCFIQIQVNPYDFYETVTQY